MQNTFSTSVSGLLAHQSMLKIAGNNIANVNTTGFKAQRISFADTLYEVQRGPSSAVQGSIGGRNPIEVGTGVAVGHVDRNQNQGSLESTNQTYDLAILGDGYFVLNNGNQQVLTRAGSFELDQNFRLVDKASGALVQRTGSVGIDVVGNNGFQVPGDSSIRIPIGATIEGVPSANINIRGNLNSMSESPTPKTFMTADPLLTGGALATQGTLLNGLDGAAYQVGDSLIFSGADADGALVSTTFSVDATTTVGDLLDSINQSFSLATATLESGNIVLRGNEPGPSQLAVRLVDSGTNTGQGVFGADPFVVTAQGAFGDVVTTSVEFFDPAGGVQTIQVNLSKTDDGWSIDADMPSSDATLTPNPLGVIRFDSAGKLVTGTSFSQSRLPVTIAYPGSDALQTIHINLGASDGFEGLTHTAADSTTIVDSDGFGVGTLVDGHINQDGGVVGVGSNGRRVPIAQLAVARVANKNGLSAIGENHFVTSASSGQVEIGEAIEAGRGRIMSGQLESSNVDLAYELTRLIVAQRGFSANARSITVAEEILDEIGNIIR